MATGGWLIYHEGVKRLSAINQLSARGAMLDNIGELQAEPEAPYLLRHEVLR